MSFKMPTGKKLDSMLDKLSAKDIKEIRTQFELDVQKENQKETDMPNKETMSSIYEAIAEPYGHDEFEKEINDFIKDKKIIDIKFQENFSISED